MPMIDTSLFRKTLGHYPTGVCAITAIDGDRPVAMVVGSFTSVSLDPPLVGFFPDRNSTSWPRIRQARRFCVNVLGSHQQGLCRTISSKAEDKFDALSFRLSDGGSPILDDVVAWIDCELHSVTDAGDHFIALGLVERLAVENPRAPLIFCQGGYGQFAALEMAGQAS